MGRRSPLQIDPHCKHSSWRPDWLLGDVCLHCGAQKTWVEFWNRLLKKR